MTRRPRTDQQLAELSPIVHDPLVSSVRASSRKDLLDELPTVGPKKSTAKKRPDFRKALLDSTTYGEQIIKGDWEPRDERDLVGLYAALHRHVYGVDALELREELGAARSSCRKLLREEFAGDPLKLQAYLAWAMKRARDWKRSKERADEEVVRVGWRLIFKNRKWLVDFMASRGR